MSVPATPAEVQAVFERMASPAREQLLDLRRTIFEVATQEDVGPLTETLKWGEPAYLTEASKAGSTIRLGLARGHPAVFFNCNTTLVAGFRETFGDAFAYQGNRAVLLTPDTPPDALAICLARALTYHRAKKGSR